VWFLKRRLYAAFQGTHATGFPTAQQSTGLLSLPSWFLGRQKGFVVCERRPKALPLESAAFEKGGRNFIRLLYVNSMLILRRHSF